MICILCHLKEIPLSLLETAGIFLALDIVCGKAYNSSRHRSKEMGIRACIYFHNEEEIRRVKLFLAGLRSGLDKAAAVATIESATSVPAKEPTTIAEPAATEAKNPFYGLEMTADGFYILPEGKEIEDYLG